MRSSASTTTAPMRSRRGRCPECGCANEHDIHMSWCSSHQLSTWQRWFVTGDMSLEEFETGVDLLLRGQLPPRMARHPSPFKMPKMQRILRP